MFVLNSGEIKRYITKGGLQSKQTTRRKNGQDEGRGESVSEDETEE